jgi:hypothetical protein
LRAKKDPRFRYADWKTANHSALYMLLFQTPDRLLEYHGFRNQGAPKLDDLLESRNAWHQRLKQDLKDAAASGQDFLFSAEDISDAQYESARASMHEYFSKWSDDVRVVGYVRAPLSFAKSAFQEMLKSGTMCTLDETRLWPYYRPRFESLFSLFGEDKIELRKYSRGSLIGGDVVTDFCSVIGMDCKDYTPRADNESLGAEATAILFAMREFCDGVKAGGPQFIPITEEFLQTLRATGNRRFTFADSLWRPLLEAHADDLSWIESKIGQKLEDDESRADDVAISSAADLQALALESSAKLYEILIDRLRSYPADKLQRVAMAADALLRHCS